MSSSTKRNLFLGLSKIVMFMGLTILPSSVWALSFTLGPTAFSGSNPSGSITATFTDVAGGVQLVMSASGLSGSEFIGEWDFNADPSLDLSQLSITFDSGQAAQTVGKNTDSFKADGTGGSFDIQFAFATANNDPNRFTAGETSTYLFSYAGNGTFNANSFNFLSANSPGNNPDISVSAAHVQAIDADPTSGWVKGTVDPGAPVPEPSTILLLGSGVVGLTLLRRRKKS